jgi:uncharacterized damage-inducible protein DinB
MWPIAGSPVVTMPSTAVVYRSRAVRALVLLHEEQLRRFLVVWNQARAASVALPRSDDPAYASLETLLRHVLGAARGYMTWMCEVLELPDPEIRTPPDPPALVSEADSYMEHVLERWRAPLRDVGDDRLETPEYPSRWKTLYSIDAMLEHAVIHPIRHAFQLEELMHLR